MAEGVFWVRAPGTPVSVTPVSVTLVINFDRSSNSRPKSGHVGNVRRSQSNADKGSKRSTAASVASEKMVKKKPTNSKKKGGTKAVKKSAIKVSLLRLPVKKGEAQRSYKALEAKRAKEMKKAAAQRRRQAKQAAQRAKDEASNFDRCQNEMKGRWKDSYNDERADQFDAQAGMRHHREAGGPAGRLPRI